MAVIIKHLDVPDYIISCSTLGAIFEWPESEENLEIKVK